MSDKIYCKAPWVSTSYMPGNKFAPCCQWTGQHFDSPEQVIQQVGGEFLNGNIPAGCQSICGTDIPHDRPDRHYRKIFDRFQTDFQSLKVQFLDFRNNNLCNLKCRSCGPQFSTSWSAEMGGVKHEYEPADLIDMDFSHCEFIYFAGGEPLLNPQHYELLEHLVKNKLNPTLQYSTNMTVLGTKDKSVKDIWPYFRNIKINASIDAVGDTISSVRSGTKWHVIESNLNWMRTQKNVNLSITPVISALSIWWIDELFCYFDWLPSKKFSPILVYSDGPHQLGLIPQQYRHDIIESMKNSKFKDNLIIQAAILELQTIDRSQQHWASFIARQLLLDKRRNESWFDRLPIRDKLFQELAYNTNTWIS